MFKKLFTIFMLILAIVVSGVSAFAGQSYKKDDSRIRETSQFLVNITRPEGNESTFKKSYVICGNTSEQGVVVELYRFDESSKSYEPYENTDGESNWKIGISGIFMKEVQLDKGANDIMIIAYKESNADKKQVNRFTITVLDEGIKEKIKNGIDNIGNILKSIFK
ncbi:MAG: hypothetical protein N3B21_19105 [Clostridia bacterium]|nr:hypothetical protein [Clostridia bacterium]